MRNELLSRGQNLMELALVVGIVGLVFMGMQVYIKRGIQGRVKDLTDHILSGKQSAGDAKPTTVDSGASSEMTEKEAKGGIKAYVGTETSYNDPAPVTSGSGD